MKHDYKAALNRFDKHLTQSDPDANGKTLTRHGGAFFTDSEIVAIRKSLKIADKLMQEPSEGMLHIGKQATNVFFVTGAGLPTDNFPMHAMFKAMRDQLLREIEQENSQ